VLFKRFKPLFQALSPRRYQKLAFEIVQRYKAKVRR